MITDTVRTVDTTTMNERLELAALTTSRIEFEQEADGRWLAEMPDLPGVMAYGATRDEAADAARALALRVLAERADADGERGA